MKKNSIPNRDIDGRKLQDLLHTYCAENHTSIAKMSEEAGFSKGYLHYSFIHNTLSQMAIFYLETKGIKSSEYLVAKKPKIILEKAPVVEEVIPKQKTVSDLTPEEFSELIKDAFLSAWKQV